MILLKELTLNELISVSPLSDRISNFLQKGISGLSYLLPLCTMEGGEGLWKLLMSPKQKKKNPRMKPVLFSPYLIS